MQSQKTSESPSPTKRSSFRSKTKLPTPQQSKQRSIASYKMYLKQFPFGMPEDVMRVVQSFQPVHNQFIDNLDNLRLYKMQLASQFEGNWLDFMQVLKNIIIKLNKRIEKSAQQKQSQIAHLLQLNSQSQKEVQKIKEKLQHIEHIRQIEKAQLDVANTEVETVNREMSDIYDILRGDMGKILKYLTQVEKSKEKETNESAEKIYTSLQKFNTVLSKIETEQKGTASTLSTMREMIKAMARSTKTTTGTQVDQSELLTKAENIFGNFEKKAQQYNYDNLSGAAVNSLDKGKYDHVIDKLKIKEKDIAHEVYHPKTSVEKPWALTPTLLTFLENMTKQNEAGRVLPWEYMKSLINQIYEERIKNQQQIISGMVGNSMLFDQFVVYYFLKKYRIRRLTEVKLLQFITSLKYYSKFWLKAELFCIMMDIMRYIPIFDKTDTFDFKTDYYAQNYFFQMYKVITNFQIYSEEDGTVYIPIKKVKKIMKFFLFFTDQSNRSRIMAKVDKNPRIFDKMECVDFDYSLMLFMEEYFLSRKRMSSQISRLFSKTTQKIEGYFSIDELLNIFNDFSKVYNAGEQFTQKYPVQSQLHMAKLYLYAITSGKNNYEITNANFIQACSRYGFDSPFPFLHSCQKSKLKRSESLSDQRYESGKLNRLPSKIQIQKMDQLTQQNEVKEQSRPKSSKPQNEQQISETKAKYINLNQQRIDVASKLFSQHFSLLRQLKDYVTIFSSTLVSEKDPQVLWKSFNQIKLVLEKGCSFMKYPLIAK